MKLFTEFMFKFFKKKKYVVRYHIHYWDVYHSYKDVVYARSEKEAVEIVRNRNNIYIFEIDNVVAEENL